MLPIGLRCLISSTRCGWSGQQGELLLLDDPRLSAYAILRRVSQGGDQLPTYYAIQRLVREAARQDGLILYIVASREEGWQLLSSLPHSDLQDALAEVLAASGLGLAGEAVPSFIGPKEVWR